jgi:outer membrane biosynthesis protein TonB
MRKIFLTVLAVHVLVMLSLLCFKPSLSKVATRKPIAVRTVTQSPSSSPRKEKPMAAVKPGPTPRTPYGTNTQTLRPGPTPSSRPTPPPVPPPPLPPTIKPLGPRSLTKKSAPQPTPSSGIAQPNKEKLIAMMQKSLSTLDGGKQHTTTPLPTHHPVAIEALASESLSSFEARYEEELIAYLEALLSLPEKGEVRLKLTVKQGGDIQKIEIIKASSQRNKEYIEKNIALCSFPPFGKHFKGEESHTFTITLLSENSH